MPQSRTSRTKTRAAALSVASNTTLVVAKTAVALATGSISILSEALHSANDLLAAIMAFFAVRASSQPPDEAHRYGHGKFESLSGTFEGLLVVGVAVMIAWKAIPALMHEHHFKANVLGMGVMTLSAVLNLIVSRYLFHVARRTHSLALEADALHLSTDVYTSAAVVGGLVIVRFTAHIDPRFNIVDPLLALAVAALIAWQAAHLIRRGLSDLVDSALPRDERGRIEQVLREHQALGLSFHELRSRRSGPARDVDLHLELPSAMTVEQAHEVCDHLEQEIRSILPGSQVLIHVEPASSGNGSKRK